MVFWFAIASRRSTELNVNATTNRDDLLPATKSTAASVDDFYSYCNVGEEKRSIS